MKKKAKIFLILPRPINSGAVLLLPFCFLVPTCSRTLAPHALRSVVVHSRVPFLEFPANSATQ